MQKKKKKADRFEHTVMFFASSAWCQVLNETSQKLGMSKSEIMRASLFEFLKSKQAKERKARMEN